MATSAPDNERRATSTKVLRYLGTFDLAFNFALSPIRRAEESEALLDIDAHGPAPCPDL